MRLKTEPNILALLAGGVLGGSRRACCLAALCANAVVQAQSALPLLHFSAQPSESEIFQSRVFDEPLLPCGGTPAPDENKALAEALSAYASRVDFDDLSAFPKFLDHFPDGAWSGSLLLHLGNEYYSYGYYSKALDSWERAWQILKKSKDRKSKPQADRAAGELARMYSKLGRKSELDQLLASISDRSLIGPGTQLIHGAQQAVWLMQHQPEICFRCGPMALDSILADTEPGKAGKPLILQSQSPSNGFSLPQVEDLSRQVGMNYQMAFRSPGAPWIVPAVIHWRVGHYAALIRREGNRVLVKDHTFQSSLWVSLSTLEQEGSGYFLIPPGSPPPGWRAVSSTEAKDIRGRGQINGQDPNQTGQNAMQTGGTPNPTMCTANPGNTTGSAPGDSSGATDPAGASTCGGSCAGMTTYTFDTMLAGLCLNDTPIGYKPPVGPWIQFTATYSQYEANQPSTFSYGNLGPQWTCNWIGYITDEPNSIGNNVSCYEPGGGTLIFTGYDSTTGTFAPETMTQGILTRISSTSYQIKFRTGVTWIFALPNGAVGNTREVFLTQILDAASNSVTLRYNSDFLLTNITDAIGQSTTITYENPPYTNTIASVTDPFGRTAYLQYNEDGQLIQITDEIGITSGYTYGSNGFITALTTPYGTTHFSTGTNFGGGPWIQATDPLEETEFAAAPFDAIVSLEIDPIVPTNLPVTPVDNYLAYRDTYFWGRQAYALGGTNTANATVYHFLHSATNINVESGVLESVKKPLENRVWYSYANMQSGLQLGTASINRPIAVGRVLDDGFSQTYLYHYNPLGGVTNETDPFGRSFSYLYSTNNVDLLQIIMTSHGRSEIQFTLTYNSQHKPLTITDASGQTTTNTYNSRGQILSIADPLGEMTTFAYDTNGYLLSITGPLQASNDVTRFTYDGYGRVQTVTDTEGYTLTYAYDAMDRATNINHPDSTSEEFVYSNLDLVASGDRLGRWTTNTYNADRQLVRTSDPLGRVTQYDYCDCGALDAIIDPAGNTTWWDHDVQSRIVGKFNADGSGIIYNYENTTSRLHLRTDERGQETIYQYYDDNNPQSISYANAIVATPTVSYSYDTNYNRILTMTDGIGTTSYAYNPVTSDPVPGAGRLASVSGPLPNSFVAYQYDALERATNRTINGVSQTTTFDTLGRPVMVTNALGTFQYGYVDATPRLALEAYPNGQTNLYSYYGNLSDQRLLQIRHLYPDGTLISGDGYSYNAVGQITAWTNEWDTLPLRVWLPAYDADDELTNIVVEGGAGPVTNYVYAYDPAGNRALAEANGILSLYSFNLLNQIIGSSATITNVGYQWDSENHLVAIMRGSNTSRFSYDGVGRRVQVMEFTNGVLMTNNSYLWCGTDICEVRDATGAATLRRLFGQGEALSRGMNYFYTRDHLGSVREALDTNAVIDARYDYDPYGQKFATEENFQATFGFAGYFIHQNSGLYLTWFRAFDSTTARWLSRDPILENGNAYLYSFDDPIKYSDRLGLVPSPMSIQQLLRYLSKPSTQKQLSRLLFQERRVPKDLKDVNDVLDSTGAEVAGKDIGEDVSENKPCDADLDIFLFVGGLVAGETPVGLAFEVAGLAKDLWSIGSILNDIGSNNEKIAELQEQQSNVGQQ